MKKIVAVVGALALAGCVVTSSTTFVPATDQQVIVRNGHDALISRKRASTVAITSSGSGNPDIRTPVAVVVCNTTRRPTLFRVSDIKVTTAEGRSLTVWSRDGLTKRIRNEAFVAAIVGGAVAGGGIAAVSPQYNSPLANEIVVAGATSTGYAVATNSLIDGQIGVARAGSMLADNTVMAGECLGGDVVFDTDRKGGLMNDKTYIVSIPFGDDMHQFQMRTTTKT